ncbi:uncharacterized protein ARMOST_11083 [Armillaria ostoyae]|uniref:Nas2 N-terminal domain-containing protein n=1 Tax=Armillaria ostoyae TaxID=47428 RepID=A0A284RG49_ARMOS|nr:uncharacterized protein ARMOST_11083 [Armillaria ostoyae]
MGMELPSPDSPREQVRVLMGRKSDIEAELETQLSILKANSSTLHSPLVDPDGFPRADIDIYAVRGARIRIIELRNDLEALMNEIGKKLENIYDPSLVPQNSESPADTPFARVDGVAPGSPAADAGLRREDLIVKFGSLTSPTSLQAVAEVVGANENVGFDSSSALILSDAHIAEYFNQSSSRWSAGFLQPNTEKRLGWTRDARRHDIIQVIH